jgi:hypothetical protein
VSGKPLSLTFGGRPETRFWNPLTSLWFLDDDRVAVTLVTQTAAGSASPFGLHAVLIDARSGRVLAVPEWPSGSRYAVIAAANDAGFVVEAGQDLTLVSPSMVPLSRTSLPQPPAPPRGLTVERFWRPKASWSGRHILFAGEGGPWLWLDAQRLRIVESLREAPIRGLVVAPDRLDILGAPTQVAGAIPAAVLRGLREHDPSSPFRLLLATFVGPDLLYVTIGGPITPTAPRAILMRPDGFEIFRLGAPRTGLGPGPVGPAASRNGTRFVILLERLRGSFPSLDIGGYRVVRELLVYDSPFREASSDLDVVGSKLRNVSHAALSPDGRHLALLSDNPLLLEVFDLPPAR